MGKRKITFICLNVFFSFSLIRKGLSVFLPFFQWVFLAQNPTFSIFLETKVAEGCSSKFRWKATCRSGDLKGIPVKITRLTQRMYLDDK